MYWILFLLSGFILLSYYGLKTERKINLQLLTMGFTPSAKMITDKLIDGHPEVNNTHSKTIIFLRCAASDILTAKSGMVLVSCLIQAYH